MLVAGPLNTYNLSLAYVETLRDRLYLRTRGLALPKSKAGDVTEDDIIQARL